MKRRSEESPTAPTPALIGVLPAEHWVIERVESNGFRSILPLAGWGVDGTGSLHVLPLELETLGWTARPRRAGDESKIEVTTRGLARHAGRPAGGVDIEDEGVTRYE